MKASSVTERSALQIVEEAVYLLREASPAAVLAYLTGSIPFLLGLLFFMSDMMRSPFAFEHVAAASLGLALLYVWKSVWQAIFAAQLYDQLSPGARRPISLPRLILTQATIQPLNLLALPIGLLVTIPLPWIVAFFRNVAIFCALGEPDAIGEARRQANLGTRQNWGILGLMSIAGLLLFANVLMTVAVLPQIGRSFLGIEGDLARLGIRILNLTTVSVAGALTWLALDPLLDAIYVLRCFYGKSVATGEDLGAAFRRAVQVAAVFFLLLFIGGQHANAQPRQSGDPQIAPAVPSSRSAGTSMIDPQRLSRSIDETVRRREFTWRVPRPPGEEPQGRWVGWVRGLLNMVDDAEAWLARLLRRWMQPPPPSAPGKDAPVTPRMLELAIGLAVALAVAAAIVFFRRRRRPVVVATAAANTALAVDLADESITADQLAESAWMKLVEECLGRGEFRLALRAFYLAGLTSLGESGLVSIRRWKSGLDYRREVERRGRAFPGVTPIFARNVALFERGWYGRHEVDRTTVDQFTAGLSEIAGLLESVRGARGLNGNRPQAERNPAVHV